MRLVETQQPCRSGEYAEEPVFLRLDYYQMFHCFSPACFRMLFTVPRAGSSFGFRAKYKTPFASMLELLMTFLLRSKYYSSYSAEPRGASSLNIDRLAFDAAKPIKQRLV